MWAIYFFFSKLLSVTSYFMIQLRVKCPQYQRRKAAKIKTAWALIKECTIHPADSFNGALKHVCKVNILSSTLLWTGATAGLSVVQDNSD